ncbi:hypothetical protein HYG87_07545 [Methanobacterium alkalithermotolerans]|uniref:Uncharacterized protein n=1 Tax=Methanobacterium alkalithermotolerans TaxID=2731220 RepID=A0A8T8K7V3_9EURY|nr:hypothetical protein [Methanobacterium alkalithermotolerans]QUH23625.1 hypothetical protein HYG87_07545 [Methanobacterium alkalithermotolerans]
MNPKFYQKQIAEVGVDGMKIEPSSLAEAMSLLVKLRNYKKLLEKIKFNLHMDMRSIRKEYLEKIQSLKEEPSRRGLFRKNLTEKDKRSTKKNIYEERDRILAPYEALERLIEDYLDQIEDSKTYLELFIQKETEYKK